MSSGACGGITLFSLGVFFKKRDGDVDSFADYLCVGRNIGAPPAPFLQVAKNKCGCFYIWNCIAMGELAFCVLVVRLICEAADNSIPLFFSVRERAAVA